MEKMNGFEVLNKVKVGQLIAFATDANSLASERNFYKRNDQGNFVGLTTTKVLPIDNTFVSSIFNVYEEEEITIEPQESFISFEKAIELIQMGEDVYIRHKKHLDSDEEETNLFAFYGAPQGFLEVRDRMKGKIENMVEATRIPKGAISVVHMVDAPIPLSALLTAKFFVLEN